MAINLSSLATAWRRISANYRQYCLNNPYAIELVELDLEGWLNNLIIKLKNGTYQPSPSEAIDIPKAEWHVRKGIILQTEDIVVYEAIALDCIEAISNILNWSAMSKRFSSILNSECDSSESNGNRWFDSGINTWNRFNCESLERIESGAGYVVYGNVSGFFDNIDHQLLIRDLRDAGVEERTYSLLLKCLSCWMQPIQKGIPQNIRSSHLFADLYMNEIDHRLCDAGFDHLRYTDDIRIFCQSEREARMAICRLTNMLRDKGLSIHTGKTRILTASEAEGNISLVGNLIREMGGEPAEELDPYGSGDISFTVNPEINALRKAFTKHFIRSKTFNKTLFHYIINRLGAAGDDSAVGYCYRLLRERPEESDYILNNYFPRLADDQMSFNLAKYVLSEDILYDYQTFLIMRWLYRYSGCIIGPVQQAAQYIITSNTPEYIRNYGFAILGKIGNEDDLKLLVCCYNGLVSDVSRATLICSIHSMKPYFRDRFYEGIRGDSWLLKHAFRWVESFSSVYSLGL